MGRWKAKQKSHTVCEISTEGGRGKREKEGRKRRFCGITKTWFYVKKKRTRKNRTDSLRDLQTTDGPV